MDLHNLKPNVADQRRHPVSGDPAESGLLAGAAPDGKTDGIRHTGRALRPASTKALLRQADTEKAI